MIERIKRYVTSTRFWSVLIIAVVGFLTAEGEISQNVADLIYTILGGYVGLATIDKFRK